MISAGRLLRWAATRSWRSPSWPARPPPAANSATSPGRRAAYRSRCRTPAPCAIPTPASPWPPATTSACSPAPSRTPSHHHTTSSRAAGEAARPPAMPGRPHRHRGPRTPTSEHRHRTDAGPGLAAGAPGEHYRSASMPLAVTSVNGDGDGLAGGRVCGLDHGLAARHRRDARRVDRVHAVGAGACDLGPVRGGQRGEWVRRGDPPAIVEAQEAAVSGLGQGLSGIERRGGIFQQRRLGRAAGLRERAEHGLMRRLETALRRRDTPAATSPERIQPAWTICVVIILRGPLDGLAERARYGTPQVRPSLPRYGRQDMLADWPGLGKGLAPLIRIVDEPCIPGWPPLPRQRSHDRRRSRRAAVQRRSPVAPHSGSQAPPAPSDGSRTPPAGDREAPARAGVSAPPSTANRAGLTQDPPGSIMTD